jgi:hypothetical protein
MFALPVLEESSRLRDEPGQLLSEAVATFGLVLTVMGVRLRGALATGAAVGGYIAAAYWFTASTSPMGGNGTGNTSDPKPASENGGVAMQPQAPEPTRGDGSPGNF